MQRNFAIGVLCLLAVPAHAEMPSPPCWAAPSSSPSDAAASTAIRAITAAMKPPAVSDAVLTLDQGAQVTLQSTADISYAANPARPGAPGSFGGMLGLGVAASGTYRIALGVNGWIDVVDNDGRLVPSSAHAPGPPCSRIRKTVDFPLRPGRYIVEIAASDQAQTMIRVSGPR